jgi:anti-sigma factor RsiW
VIDDIADWDAAYVLGALSPDDRRSYETFLTENPGHAAAVAELAELPGILATLGCDEALALIGVDGDCSAGAARWQRSKRGMLVAGFAVVAVVAVGAGAIGTVDRWRRGTPCPQAASTPSTLR